MHLIRAGLDFVLAPIIKMHQPFTVGASIILY
jgi:hypothetical protein